MTISTKEIEKAYIQLKRSIYYESSNLFIRDKVAEFEYAGDMGLTFADIAKVLSGDNKELFTSWLKGITFRVFPKKIGKPEKSTFKNSDEGLVITNNRVLEKYEINSYRYYIDAPIQILIIDTYWATHVGVEIDKKLSNSCYGSRLDTKKLHFSPFKYYVHQYKAWRDNALNAAKDLLENKKKNAAILSLDITQFFDCIDMDFDVLKTELKCDAIATDLIESIYSEYSRKIHEAISLTHEVLSGVKFKGIRGIPIGLASSYILANWYLDKFDRKVMEEVRPTYYGRYVDDMLVVMESPDKKSLVDIDSFLKEYFSTIFRKCDKGEGYVLIDLPSLHLQSSKVILHDFRKDQSIASLNKFSKELSRISSLFRFLPGDEVECELDEAAYSLLGNSTTNKFRDIAGAKEDAYALSRYLALQIIAHRLTDDDIGKVKVVPQLLKFFNGQNFLDFYRLQEKVFSFMIIKEKHKEIKRFYGNAVNEIKKITTPKQAGVLAAKLREKTVLDLLEHLRLSLVIPLGLESPETAEAILQSLGFSASEHEALLRKREAFRYSNLIRQQYVLPPLANYTSYKGSLISGDSLGSLPPLRLDAVKLKFAPRFIHFNEFELFEFMMLAAKNAPITPNYIEKVIKNNKQCCFSRKEPQNTNPTNDTIEYWQVRDNDSLVNKFTKNIKVAIANLKISLDDVKASCVPYLKPNISFARQSQLYQLLNEAEREQVKLLVLPEVAIPHHWLPFMINHSRRHQIALIFGLEHWVIGKTVHNYLVSVFPFKQSEIYNSCGFLIREKNYFSPEEKSFIGSMGLTPAEPKDKVYQHVDWNGLKLASYNCFELTNIKHRSLFRGEIDLLTASVFNKDVNYYKNIIESTVRDLHSYVIQSNSSHHGGSCVVQPTKTEKLNKVNVKGGENHCILTDTLDICSLRRFQFNAGYHSDDFKPLPAGFNVDGARVRRSPKE